MPLWEKGTLMPEKLKKGKQGGTGFQPVTKSKNGWTRVAFGDVVRQARDRVDPENTDLERYVAGEHMDTDDLKIRRWGLIGDGYLGPAFHMRFKPGHVLYGSRRTYLRKVAVADFEGVTANTTFVLESKDPDVLLPELLPFIMQTESFHDHSIKQSKGSVNPYINFSDLTWYEFALPPFQEQRRIAEVLEACIETTEALHRATRSAEIAFRAALRLMMANAAWPTVSLGELATVDRGKFSHRPRNLPQFFGGPYPFVQTGDVAAAQGRSLRPSQTLSEEGVQYSKSFPEQSILITIAAVIGATAITTEETWCTDSVVGIVPFDRGNVDFIEYTMRYLRPHLEHEVATQTAQKNINLEVLRPLLLPWPTEGTRADVVRTLAGIESAAALLFARVESTRRIARAIADQLAGDRA